MATPGLRNMMFASGNGKYIYIYFLNTKARRKTSFVFGVHVRGRGVLIATKQSLFYDPCGI